jgi:hypothetical protein
MVCKKKYEIPVNARLHSIRHPAGASVGYLWVETKLATALEQKYSSLAGIRRG